MSRKTIFKPFTFTTTVRNPQRYKEFLKILVKYNGQILSNEVINKIILDLIRNRLYRPVYVSHNSRLKEIFDNNNGELNDDDLMEIFENSPQKHKEAGFDHGWSSRFDTIYKMAMELGFVYYEMRKPLEISESGMLLVKSLDYGCLM